jgi:hypothetical protein
MIIIQQTHKGFREASRGASYPEQYVYGDIRASSGAVENRKRIQYA